MTLINPNPQRMPLSEYPKQPRSRTAADRSQAALRTLAGTIGAQQALVEELDAALAVGLKRADERKNTRDRIVALAKQARGQQR